MAAVQGRALQEPDLAQERVLPSQRVLSWAEGAVGEAAPLPSLALRWALLRPLRAQACPPGQERSAAAPQPPLEASAQHMQDFSTMQQPWVAPKGNPVGFTEAKHIARQLTCDSSCRKLRTLAWSSCDAPSWLEGGASPPMPSCRLRRTAAMSAGTLIDWPSLHARFWCHTTVLRTNIQRVMQTVPHSSCEVRALCYGCLRRKWTAVIAHLFWASNVP